MDVCDLDDVYDLDNFELTIKKSNENITITLREKKYLKIFRVTFTEETINEICPVGLHNFCVIIENAITEKNNSKIFIIHDNNDDIATIKIKYECNLKFEFDIVLSLVPNSMSLNQEELCIKQLENKIIELEKMQDSIKNTMDNMMHLIMIYFSRSRNITSHYFLPTVCNKIIFNLGTNGVNQTTNENYETKDFTMTFTHPNDILLPTFQNIKFKTLEINFFGVFINCCHEMHIQSILENLSTHIDTLILNNFSKKNFDYINKIFEKVEINTLEIRNCHDISFTQEEINELAPKKLKYFNCTNFEPISTTITKIIPLFK